MYKKNNSHFQIPLTSHVDELPEKLQKGIKEAWSGTFYKEFFCRIDETPFAVLYADCPSRPNIPVNVLVSLEFLKAGHGWTDEQLYEQYCYNVQVRYAVGYRQLGEGHFDLRTLYNFRERLSRYMQETGINLLDHAFEQVTDEQIEAFQIKTGKQRMDSTQIASNIRQMGRIQLLVTVIQRVQRMLSEKDQAHYTEALAPFVKGHAGQYVYRMKREETDDHLQKIGELMQRLLIELRPNYEAEPIYQVMERVFSEHFQVEQDTVQSKPNAQLSASSLQSPDDLEATYRNKRGQGYQGYTANLTETCDPDNELQLTPALAAQVQVLPKFRWRPTMWMTPNYWMRPYPSSKSEQSLKCCTQMAGMAVRKQMMHCEKTMWSRSRPPFGGGNPALRNCIYPILKSNKPTKGSPLRSPARRDKR